MKNLLQVTTEVDKPALLKNLIEKLAIRNNEFHTLKNELPKPWMAFETSSVESYLTGTMNISISETETINIPFISSHMFVCRRENNDPYKLKWSVSLS